MRLDRPLSANLERRSVSQMLITRQSAGEGPERRRRQCYVLAQYWLVARHTCRLRLFELVAAVCYRPEIRHNVGQPDHGFQAPVACNRFTIVPFYR